MVIIFFVLSSTAVSAFSFCSHSVLSFRALSTVPASVHELLGTVARMGTAHARRLLTTTKVHLLVVCHLLRSACDSGSLSARVTLSDSVEKRRNLIGGENLLVAASTMNAK